MSGYLNVSGTDVVPLPRPRGYSARAAHRPRRARTSLFGWWRTRKAERLDRRAQAARQRALKRLARLGPDWRVLDAQTLGMLHKMDYLVIGPGGIFTIRVKDHKRAQLMLAGDVIQINGRRPPYITGVRKEAAAVAEAFSRAAGTKIPVIPILVFVGSGKMSAQGLPKACLVTPYKELDSVLDGRGMFLSEPTVERLWEIAARPEVWSGRVAAA